MWTVSADRAAAVYKPTVYLCHKDWTFRSLTFQNHRLNSMLAFGSLSTCNQPAEKYGYSNE